MRTVSEYAELMKAICDSVMVQSEFKSSPDFSELLQEKHLLILLNHAAPLSWIPASSLLTTKFVEAGAGDRIPLGVADKWFYTNPLGAKFAHFFTQSNRALSFDELVEHFQKEDKTDLVLFPEGANTFFSDVKTLAEFRSPRFIEIALQSGAPILMVCHQGSEGWTFPLRLPPQWGMVLQPFAKFFASQISQGLPINLPLIGGKIPLFKMHCKLYRPTLKLEDLSDDADLRRSQLWVEAHNVRKEMLAMLDKMQA